MTDTVLPKGLAIALLTKLANDDGFRARYVAHPDQGLLEIGVPPNDIAALPPTSTVPLKVLADKSVFAVALTQLQVDAAEVCLCLLPPAVRLKIGS